ncbi:heterokaryon incompatibility protein-domain-containing protein [Aspergillus minisclerotigenes]|uniref:Heterokaryon incompatibility protein-domain-containing protein n=1 Tax=Aspergillus minisclerotigenes TaxID=656917 RepID=A0A5N6JCC7_9EURO|nr:heterokaryon incompatibility protein-domain-containing protein [Aspergillus minisclerotigenes]
MNPSILKDCPVCHNFEPGPEESIERSSDGRIWSGRYRRWIPTNAAGEHGFAFNVEIDVVRNQASNSYSRIPWKRVAKITSSPRYVLTHEHRDWYLSWVRECFDNHPKWQRSCAMPRRLIDLGDDDKRAMCLRDDIAQISRYIALSHNWQVSEARNCMTLKVNYGSQKRSIPQQGLSQTFQDTIKVARWLGVRYLWIDTFCIIQDDPDDWAEQAAHMGDIFEGAYITIAAHCYQNSPPTDGCFLERNVFNEVALPDGNGDQMVCARAPSLAPHSPFSAMGGSGDVLHMSGCEQELNGDKCRDTWEDIVRVYSAANLTVPTDRLAALSSMVQRMPRQIFGDYLAGLWSNNLIEQLSWTTCDKTNYSRYQQYVAPSFSWASIHGGSVTFSRVAFQRIKQKACLLDAGTVPVGQDPMGPVREGFIHLRLRICEAKVISTRCNPTEIYIIYYCKDGQLDSCRASVDAEDDMKGLDGQMVCLGELFNETKLALYLVIRKVADREGVFRRIGIGNLVWRRMREDRGHRIPNTHGHRDPFCQVPEQEIRLI